MKIRMLIVLFLFAIAVSAQEFNTSVPKKIIIISSTKNYAAAKKLAIAAAKKLKKEVIFGGLTPNPKIGLTMSRADCETYGYPCYIARGEGNAENTTHISVEYSSAYEGFAKGYYIVVAGIGDPKSAELASQLKSVQKVYKDAYAKQTKVWYGCMH
jgi:hypothetical protein